MDKKEAAYIRTVGVVLTAFILMAAYLDYVGMV